MSVSAEPSGNGAAMSAPNSAAPPQTTGPMQKREARLAFSMLAPTFLIIFLIVLGPLLANFWISVKPVELGDLRAPTLLVNERVRGKPQAAGDPVTLQYRLRNSSQDYSIFEVSFTDTLPSDFKPTAWPEACSVDGTRLSCTLGDIPGKWRERLDIEGVAGAAFAEYRSQIKDTELVYTGEADNVLTNLDFTLDNFRRIFDADEFWSVLRVSFYYTVFGTAGALVLGLFAAQLLNTSFKGRGFLRGLFLFPYVSPVIAVAFTWLVLLDPFSGTVNALLTKMGVVSEPINFFGQRAIEFSLFGLPLEFPLALSTVIAFEAWRYFPLSFLFILARMQSISSDMYEAAEMDGATPLQQFRWISLPQLLGILSVLFLLRFIWTFNKFDDIFLLTGGNAGTRTLTVDVYEQGFALSNLGAGAAVAVVVFVVLVTFATLFIKFSAKEEGL
ncbi:sugar ABC transporter permease [Pseudovibrio exalbescens]|uniref:carbohydrate ABC transporter permease n=1 Tax=Pseudovibrio exalbescens TaxID=197461 RepID=UPI002365C4C2|nr:sugar ABC transporter permease [Pseudovibrio exalbescens]MDD7911976.1 sugar ABC transporter permease [Pseudovibrio exalbescens]